MAHLTLNCPACRRQLVYVALDGLTLQYRCAEHGLILMRPLIEVTGIDEAPASSDARQHPKHDAA